MKFSYVHAIFIYKIIKNMILLNIYIILKGNTMTYYYDQNSTNVVLYILDNSIFRLILCWFSKLINGNDMYSDHQEFRIIVVWVVNINVRNEKDASKLSLEFKIVIIFGSGIILGITLVWSLMFFGEYYTFLTFFFPF